MVMGLCSFFLRKGAFGIEPQNRQEIGNAEM
jgi:hypothetical protein